MSDTPIKIDASFKWNGKPLVPGSLTFSELRRFALFRRRVFKSKKSEEGQK